MNFSFFKNATIPFLFVFTVLFLSSCGKENDLVSGYVIRDTKTSQNIQEEVAVESVTKAETTPMPEKKKATPLSR